MNEQKRYFQLTDIIFRFESKTITLYCQKPNVTSLWKVRNFFYHNHKLIDKDVKKSIRYINFKDF